ncbi:hypothetical protein ACTMU2_39215 [Cupriavidus basilensis]
MTLAAKAKTGTQKYSNITFDLQPIDLGMQEFFALEMSDSFCEAKRRAMLHKCHHEYFGFRRLSRLAS